MPGSRTTNASPSALPAASEAGRSIAQGQGWVSRRIGRLRTEWRFWRNVFYDACRFRRHAWLHSVRSDENRSARMLADAHFLEYGMALKQSRPGFGLARAHRLSGNLLREGPSPAVREIALRTLRPWTTFNAGSPLPEQVIDVIGSGTEPATEFDGGAEDVSAAEIRAAAQLDFLRFASARHSVRSFAPDPVPEEMLARAVEAAQQAPSSCNRQTCRAHIWTDPAMVEEVRRHQAGNRTFGHELAGIAVITSDLRHWEHPGERYQAWIDGGLFAMTFVYGLHAQGLGTCMLNWSVEAKTDRKLRRSIGLGDEHLVILLVGFGHLPDRLKVCRSPRLPVEAACSVNATLSGGA